VGPGPGPGRNIILFSYLVQSPVGAVGLSTNQSAWRAVKWTCLPDSGYNTSQPRHFVHAQ